MLLSVRDLRTEFRTGHGIVKAVDGVSLEIGEQEVDSAIERVANDNKLSKEHLLAEALAMGMSEREVRDEYRRQLLEWRLLYAEYVKSHEQAFPTGDEAGRALEAWKKAWLQSRRRAACVERLLSVAAR